METNIEKKKKKLERKMQKIVKKIINSKSIYSVATVIKDPTGLMQQIKICFYNRNNMSDNVQVKILIDISNNCIGFANGNFTRPVYYQKKFIKNIFKYMKYARKYVELEVTYGNEP